MLWEIVIWWKEYKEERKGRNSTEIWLVGISPVAGQILFLPESVPLYHVGENWEFKTHLKVSLIKFCACKSVSSWINYIMIFLIKAKQEQISSQDQKPGCALFIIAWLLTQLRIVWKIPCLNGTTKHPTTYKDSDFAKQRQDHGQWSVIFKTLALLIIPCPQLPQQQSSCWPLPRRNLSFRMLWVIAVKLLRVCFIKHRFPTTQHYSILPAHKTLFLHIYWAPDECKVYPIYLF